MADSPPVLLCHSYLPPCEGAYILATTKSGILLCATFRYRRNPTYYVSKPTTKQWEVIPNPKEKYSHCQAFAMVVLRSTPLHYKIVQFSPIDQNKFKYE
ncbi:hypothetical protein FEM48_Zijuj08G0172800 [Ziziphus jujuba var. spinosa]|uniref:Uncharacterized protein n=1 Tax=Ziziphus jujuba var. spinosa TaxID=714518 RepID=A0A978V0D2_ZIZJJ|nr:hypothetical protein FEM48_Zijuj08G0172800 [Ziziphus jujuba var. spinosa]